MLRGLALFGVLALVPASASAQQQCTTSDARHVVNLIYSHVLERAADRGSDTHVQRLRNGSATVRNVVAAVVKSSEHDQRFVSGDRQASVRNLYRHILGRDADQAGLQANAEALANQGSYAVADFMLNSPEYQEKYGDNGVPGSPGVRYCRPAGATGTAGGASEMRFRDMDANGDGTIALSEWRGTRQSFRTHDWNRDNILSGDEVRPGARRRAASLDELDFDPSAADTFSAWSEEGFDNIDHNRDGRISEAEWHYGYEAFNRVDANRDRVLSRAEFVADADDDRDDAFASLDADGDGHVELREWHGSAAAFDSLDRDNDNVLSRGEVVGSGVAPADRFASLDMNRDGRLTTDEWHWSRRSFTRQDGNGDGVITRREFGGGPVGTTGR
jgi:Ca2+-binding EF-hand superfamily protein